MDFVELETELDRLELLRARAEKDAALRFTVLHADDCVSDRLLLRVALEGSVCLKPLIDVWDGQEVIDYLSGIGKYSDRALFPFPQLLLLDLDMPYKTGLEVLAWIQTQKFPELRVVILSNALSAETIQKALALGADYYQGKPSTAWQLRGLVRRLELLMVLLYHREPKQFYASH